MSDLFIHERVMLNDWALPKYPHLKGLVGQVVDERRLPPFGLRTVTKWPLGMTSEFNYMLPDEIRSAEGEAAQPVTLRAISLWEPYALLVALGEKLHETRHWSTEYRGLLAIHAAKRWTRDEQALWQNFKFSNNRLRRMEANPPLGAMLCIVRLVNVYRTDQRRWAISEKERLYGNWQPGRFAWELQLLEVFEQPIPAKGAQGFFNWTKPVAA